MVLNADRELHGNIIAQLGVSDPEGDTVTVNRVRNNTGSGAGPYSQPTDPPTVHGVSPNYPATFEVKPNGDYVYRDLGTEDLIPEGGSLTVSFQFLFADLKDAQGNPDTKSDLGPLTLSFTIFSKVVTTNNPPVATLPSLDLGTVNP